MSKAHAVEEIARMAREMQEEIGQFTHLAELLRSTLPRLADPNRDAEFNVAVKELIERLDETTVHRLSMLLSELWLYWNTTEPASRRPSAVPVRPPSPEDTLSANDRSVLPAVMESVVNLAAYVGTAAVGGVIGNRADAHVQRMVEGARERWRARRASPDTPLVEDEAIEVVYAAAAVHGDEIDGAELLSAELGEDGSWLIRLRMDRMTLTAVVPPGDPGRARVVIRLS